MRHVRHRRGEPAEEEARVAERTLAVGPEDLERRGVRVHVDAASDAAARGIGADAFTHGDDVYLGHRPGGGVPEPGLLAHELTHVLQQRSSGQRAVQRRSRASETDDLLDWWDSGADAVKALDLLIAMTDVDLVDTVTDMLTGHQVGRLVNRLDRAGNLRFLKLVGTRTPPATRDAVMAAYPFANIATESQLAVYFQRFTPGLGARGAAPDPALRSLIPSDPSAPFGGGGATGQSPQNAPMGIWEMRTMKKQAELATEKLGPRGPEQAKYTRTPGMEMLYDWSNPIKGGLVGAGSYLSTLSATDRTGQAKLLLNQEIATLNRQAHGAVLPTRAQVIRSAAASHRLEPALVAAIILAEQRDQSRREDAADYNSAAIGHRAASSIGLGQVTVKTARERNLFADLVSPSMQKWLATKSDATTTSIAHLLSSDEFNIFAVARYLRWVADAGAVVVAGPNTRTYAPAAVMATYAQHSSTWVPDMVKLIGSEYTSTPWDDVLVTGWGDFVLEAYGDVKSAGVF